MKAAFATLAVALSCSMMPAAHADSDSTTTLSPLAHQVRVQAAHDGVGMSHVTVMTRGSEVILVGFVLQRDEIALAERSARSVDGVTSVDNWLARGR
jgi:osmotically-inducible protein OsmY